MYGFTQILMYSFHTSREDSLRTIIEALNLVSVRTMCRTVFDSRLIGSMCIVLLKADV